MSLHVALGGEFLHSFALDGIVNVRGAAGVGDWLDGAEVVFAAGAGEKAAESLEVFVALLLVAGAAVEISAVVIHLPDFDEHISQRFSAAIQYSAPEVSYFTDGRGNPVVDHDEVVVGVEGQMVGVKGPL